MKDTEKKKHLQHISQATTEEAVEEEAALVEKAFCSFVYSGCGKCHFLLGEDTMKKWKMILGIGKDKVTINLGKDMSFGTELTSSGHRALKLHKSGDWTAEETVLLMST